MRHPRRPELDRSAVIKSELSARHKVDFFSSNCNAWRLIVSVQEMIRTHPHVRGDVNTALVRCIDECFACAATCTACADACLGEDKVQSLTQCIRLNLDCADVCAAAGAVATRRTGGNVSVIRIALQACAEACRECAQECESHAGHHEHCRICSEACRRCEKACNEAVQSLPA